MAKAEDELAARLADRLIAFYAKGALTAEELGWKLLDSLVFHHAAGIVREVVRRTPTECRLELERRAREVADSAYRYVLWGIGTAPTQEQRARALVDQRRIAGLVLEALADPIPPVSSL